MSEERLNAVEKTVGVMQTQITNMSGDLRYLREKLEGYFKTHDQVIRFDEQIKVANNRIRDLEAANREQEKSITAIMVKSAGLSAIISIILTIVLAMLSKV